MLVLRCTRRLLPRPEVAATDLQETAVALGEWHVNTVPLSFPGRWFVIYTSSTTLLTVVTKGRSLKTSLPEFRTRLPKLLERCGLPPKTVNEHRLASQEVALMPTNNRQVIGSMNDFALTLKVIADEAQQFEDLDLDELEAMLAQTPMKAIGYRFPIEVVRQLSGPGTLPAA